MSGEEERDPYYPSPAFKLPVIHFVTPMWTVRHRETGEEKRVCSVDAREFEASGQWEIVEPSNP